MFLFNLFLFSGILWSTSLVLFFSVIILQYHFASNLRRKFIGSKNFLNILILLVQDTACSTGALSHLQGTMLYSSRAGEGMRLEYPFEVALHGSNTFSSQFVSICSFKVLLNKNYRYAKSRMGMRKKQGRLKG